jgi:hypothetical protein
MFVQHFHVTGSVRPDAIVRSGTIMPFPMEAGPDAVAAATIQSFYRGIIPDSPKPSGFAGGGRIDPQPEEVAMMANRLATAMSQGLRTEGVVDQRLIMAARMIMNGQPFVIRSAGRAALVRAAAAPASVANLVRTNPASNRY